MGLSDLIPRWLPRSTMGTQSVSVTSTLTRYDTKGADWSGGSVWLASLAVLWVGVSTWGQGNRPHGLEGWSPTSKLVSKCVGIQLRVGQGTQCQMSIIKMLSEGHSSLSLGLNTKSKLQTHSYQTAGGGVGGCVWVALQSGSGEKWRQGWCGSGTYTRVVKWRLCKCSGAGGAVRWH